MYEQISAKIVDVLNRNNPDLDNPDFREVSAYGIKISLSTIVNYLLILIISLFFDSVYSAIIFSVIFNLFRKYLGGYHCKTYLRCNIAFCAIFLSVLLIGRIFDTILPLNLSFIIMLLLFCGYGIWFWGPVENHHKPIFDKQKKHCHTIAKIIYIIDMISTIMFYIWLPYYGLIAALSLLSVVLLLPLGSAAERGKSNET